MYDRKLVDLFLINGDYRAPKVEAVPELSGVIEAFRRNLERISGMSRLPPYWGAVRAVRHEAIEITEDTATSALTDAGNFIAELEIQDETYLNAIDGMISGMLIGTWTAFEVLASDLWETAINDRPWTLGMNAFRSPADNRSDEELADETITGKSGQDRTDNSPISVLLHRLAVFDFDLSRSMGSYLMRFGRKWDFNRLQSIHRAYRAAFRGEGDDVFRDVFWSEDANALRVLFALRNVVVHNGGIVDTKFLDRVKHVPKWKSTQADNSIPIDGAMVRAFFSSVTDRGTKLIEFVNGWMIANPRKPIKIGR